MTAGLSYLLPEALLTLVAVAALFAEWLPGRGRGVAFAGALTAAAAGVASVVSGPHGGIVGGAMLLDGTAVFARASIAFLAAAFLLWLAGRGMPGERRQEAVALALFATAGGMLAVSAVDLVTIYIAIELATMPAYVLIGYRRRDVPGLEGTVKYFLLSLMTSLVMVYGFSFMFGVSGTTRLEGMVLGGAPIGLLGVLLALVGLFAKMSAAPFHYWAPDAYAGAPAASVAFVSTVPKVAGIVVIVRLAAAAGASLPGVSAVLAVVALASMLLGNLAAFPQTDLRRLMAYSGVAHAGYMLLGVSALTALGGAAAVLYAVAYSVPSMAIMLLAAEEGSALEDLAGLSARRPWVAWATVGWLISLVGIPPLVGFFGKLYLFSAVLSGAPRLGLGLVLVAVAMSVVSAGYYFRIVHAAFFLEPSESRSGATRSIAGDAALAVLLAAALAAGLLFSRLLEVLGSAGA